MKNMLAPTLIAFTVAGFSAPGLAAEHQHGQSSHEAMRTPATREAPLVDGLVKKIETAAGLVTLSHGPLPNGMPGMTMAFRVKNAAWIDAMTVGQTIRFAADEVDGEMTLVRFEPAR
jgi:Cu/Ag efflux protein CusF